MNGSARSRSPRKSRQRLRCAVLWALALAVILTMWILRDPSRWTQTAPNDVAHGKLAGTARPPSQPAYSPADVGGTGLARPAAELDRNVSSAYSLSRGKNAVVTLLFSEGYTVGVEVLAYSLRKANTSADLIVAYIPDFVSKRTLCKLRAHGWITRPVERIAPVIIGRWGPIQRRFFWMFTKFRLWSWTDYERLVYLDGDMLVVDNFDTLFTLPDSVKFAAVMDVWPDRFAVEFNAGMMLIRPDMREYELLLQKMETDKYNFDLDMAEQGLLGSHYQLNSYRLPFKYNVNLALSFHKDQWKRVWDEAAIIHYTNEKPFFSRKPLDSHFIEPFNAWHAAHDELLRDPVIAAEAAKCEGEDATVRDDFEYPDLITFSERIMKEVALGVFAAALLGFIAWSVCVRRVRSSRFLK